MRRHLNRNPDLIKKDLDKQATILLTTLKEKYKELLENIREEWLQLTSSQEMRESLQAFDNLRKMSNSEFVTFTKKINNDETIAHFRSIRELGNAEYEEMISGMETLLLLKEQKLPGYVIEQRLPKLFDVENREWLSLKVNLLHLPSDAPTTAIEQGKRIVGGFNSFS